MAPVIPATCGTSVGGIVPKISPNVLSVSASVTTANRDGFAIPYPPYSQYNISLVEEVDVISSTVDATAIAESPSIQVNENYLVPVATATVLYGLIFANLQVNVVSASVVTGLGSIGLKVFVNAIAVSATTSIGSLVPEILIQGGYTPCSLGVNITCDIGSISEKISLSPRIVISAQTNPIVHEVGIACPPVSASTTLRMGKVLEIVTAILSPALLHGDVHSIVLEVIPSILSVQAKANIGNTVSFVYIGQDEVLADPYPPYTKYYIPYSLTAVATIGIGLTPGGPPSYSVSVTTHVGSLVKHLNISAPPPSIAGIVFPLIPKIEIAIDECGYFSKPFPPYSEYTSNISASATANPTWGAGVISRVHCWTVLGVLSFESLSTWKPGQGIQLRGKASGINLKGRF